MISLFKQAKLATLVATVAIPSLVLAQAPQSDQTAFQADRTAATYRCETGIEIDITFMAIDNLPLIKLTHPSKRSDKNKRNLLLPQSQSGSGVRYATDLTSVHMKNDELVLISRESAITDEISAVRCAKI